MTIERKLADISDDETITATVEVIGDGGWNELLRHLNSMDADGWHVEWSVAQWTDADEGKD